MNPNYNKHKNIAILILAVIAAGLGACSYNKVSNNKPVNIDSCGINDDFYEINDVDSTMMDMIQIVLFILMIMVI